LEEGAARCVAPSLFYMERFSIDLIGDFWVRSTLTSMANFGYKAAAPHLSGNLNTKPSEKMPLKMFSSCWDFPSAK
jgi:hypothetical protein